MRALALTFLAVTPISAAWPNYSHTLMRPSSVRLIVVHETEGSYDATVAWFRNPKARAAAHYVVGRDGRIAHMVANDHPAWHAGNSYVNAHSIGVENEGLAEVDGTVTDAEYRASARLVAALLKRYRLPADRGHVIGHDQVPDPYHRGQYGGYSHHTDPGKFWDWTRYMSYVRAYRAGRTPPPRPVDVTLPGLALGADVTGIVPLAADATGADHVDFLVDGVVRATVAAAPYTWDWDTSLETNGRHVLTARAVAADGRSAIASTVVTSSTPPAPPPTVTVPALPGPLTGVVQLDPALTGRVARLELWIDGAVVQTLTSAPYVFSWDTATVTPGQHVLAIRAVGPSGKARASIQLVTTQ